MKAKSAIIASVCLLMSFGLASGQDFSLTLDHVDGLLSTDTLEPNDPVTFYLRFSTPGAPNEAIIDGATNGFRVYSPDGAGWQPLTWEYIISEWPNTTFWNYAMEINSFSVTGSGADTVAFAGIAQLMYESGAPPGFSSVVYSITTQVDIADSGKTLCLDSCWYPPENSWIWSADTGRTFAVYPAWDGPHCFTVGKGCCKGIRGNANGDEEEKINISDITYVVSFLFGIPSGPAPPCWEEGNANGDPDGKVNVSDVSYLLAYMFGTPAGPAPPDCW